MSFPIITSFLPFQPANAKQVPHYMNRVSALEKFEAAVKTIEDGLQSKHIWNVDFGGAKDVIDSVYETIGKTLYSPLRDYYHPCGGSNRYREWEDNDPRHNLGFCGGYLLNAPSFLKKLKTVKDAPELADYIAMLTEVAQLAEMIKAVRVYIEKGRKPSENPVEKDVTNTGICPVCMRRQKLTFEGILVAHGYTIPRGWGGRNGMCIGRGYKAWEFSPDGAIAFKEMMVRQRKETQRWLADLNASKHLEHTEKVRVRKDGVYMNETRTYAKGTQQYERVRKSAIYEAEGQIHFLTSDIDAIGKRIENWKVQPLMYGGAETQGRWKAKLLNSSRK